MPWLTLRTRKIAHYYHQVGCGTWYQQVCAVARYLPAGHLLPMDRDRGERPCQRCVQYVKKRAIAPAEMTQ